MSFVISLFYVIVLLYKHLKSLQVAIWMVFNSKSHLKKSLTPPKQSKLIESDFTHIQNRNISSSSVQEFITFETSLGNFKYHDFHICFHSSCNFVHDENKKSVFNSTSSCSDSLQSETTFDSDFLAMTLNEEKKKSANELGHGSWKITF